MKIDELLKCEETQIWRTQIRNPLFSDLLSLLKYLMKYFLQLKFFSNYLVFLSLEIIKEKFISAFQIIQTFFQPLIEVNVEESVFLNNYYAKRIFIYLPIYRL